MLNQAIIVGRIAKDLELKKEEEKKYTEMTMAVPRSFKNSDGIYETDFIPVILFGNIAENTTEYCQQGDIVGIKGRIQQKENGIEIIAEKVTFLSSKENK